MVMRQYQVAGRRAPKDKLDHPTIFRMNVFAPNGIVARSRFWYFLSKLEKAKRTTGEILGLVSTNLQRVPKCLISFVFSCHEIKEVKPTKVKNIGIWIRYDSRSGSHNA
jgi:large subunit ribosomal protein L18Ae